MSNSEHELEPLLHAKLAFAPDGDSCPALTIVVNFAIFAGRAASRTEIDRLGEWLLDTTDAVSIIGEERHEIGENTEATVYQVRIELSREAVPVDPAEQAVLQDRLLERASYWARVCVAEH